MKLLFDEMLKSLASWARILGIYSDFYSGKNDSELLSIARKEELILVTRDLRLHIRCQTAGVKSILIKSDAIEEQLAQLLKESGAVVTFPEKTRCAKCNGELVDASADDVKADVPDAVAKTHSKFWRCSSCKRVYWEGGHWKNILRIYEKAKAIMGTKEA
jgi:hypothetical protein